MSEFGQRLIQAVRKAAARDPLHVYEGKCMYVRNGCPACLIGHALWDLGLINESVEHSFHNEEGIDYLVDRLGFDLDSVEVTWLEEAQTNQDQRRTWMDAVRQADNFVGHL